MKKWLVTLILLVLFAPAVFITAQASHGDRVSSTECTPTSNTDVYDRFWGRLSSNSTSGMYVECPVTRKGNTAVPSNHYINLRVIDNSTTDSVSCTFIGYRQSTFYSSYQTSGDAFTGFTTLYLSLNNLPNWDMALTALCWIPGKNGNSPSSIDDYYYY